MREVAWLHFFGPLVTPYFYSTHLDILQSPEEKGGILTLFTGFAGFPSFKLVISDIIRLDKCVFKLNEVFTKHGILAVLFSKMLPVHKP